MSSDMAELNLSGHFGAIRRILFFHDVDFRIDFFEEFDARLQESVQDADVDMYIALLHHVLSEKSYGQSFSCEFSPSTVIRCEKGSELYNPLSNQFPPKQPIDNLSVYKCLVLTYRAPPVVHEILGLGTPLYQYLSQIFFLIQYAEHRVLQRVRAKYPHHIMEELEQTRKMMKVYLRDLKFYLLDYVVGMGAKQFEADLAKATTVQEATEMRCKFMEQFAEHCLISDINLFYPLISSVIACLELTRYVQKTLKIPYQHLLDMLRDLTQRFRDHVSTLTDNLLVYEETKPTQQYIRFTRAMIVDGYSKRRPKISL